MQDLSNHFRVAEWAQKNFHGRREFEWRVAMAVWSLQAGAIVLEVTGKLPRVGPWIAWPAAMAMVFFVAFFWVRNTWRANQQDKALSERFMFLAASAIDSGFQPHVPSAERITWRQWQWWIAFLGDWSAQFQVATTFFLALILAIVAQPLAAPTVKPTPASYEVQSTLKPTNRTADARPHAVRPTASSAVGTPR